MTDEQFEEVLKDMPSARTMAERAYRLGVEQERARCAVTVREQLRFIVHSNIYNRVAEIIERGQ